MDFTQRSDLDHLLDIIVSSGASDLHIGPGRRPVMRRHGKLQEIPGYDKILTQTDMDHILEKAYRSPTGPSAVQAMEDLDFSYVPAMSHEHDNLSGLAARYRVNAVSTVLGTRMVFRRLPPKPPSLQEIQVPEVCTSIIRSMRQGMILVTGPTGSGKSTTLAAWVRDLLEMGDSLHILTLENPVEFRYDDVDMNEAYITQRELGSSMKNFGSGIKSALRQDPDIILVGEMRDMDTIHLAMEAAETGHLVLGTVHTTDVATTVSRIVQVYPPEQQQAARVQLVGSLRMIVCQRLLPSVEGKRVAAREHLIFTPSIRNELLLIPHEHIASRLYDITKEEGVTMGMSIGELHQHHRISDDEHIKWMAILQEEKASVLQDAAHSAYDFNQDSVPPSDWSRLDSDIHLAHPDVFPAPTTTDETSLVSENQEKATPYKVSLIKKYKVSLVKKNQTIVAEITPEDKTPVDSARQESDVGNTTAEDSFLDSGAESSPGETLIEEQDPNRISGAEAVTESLDPQEEAILQVVKKIDIPPDMPEEIVWAVQDDPVALEAAVYAWLNPTTVSEPLAFSEKTEENDDLVWDGDVKNDKPQSERPIQRKRKKAEENEVSWAMNGGTAPSDLAHPLVPADDVQNDDKEDITVDQTPVEDVSLVSVESKPLTKNEKKKRKNKEAFL